MNRTDRANWKLHYTIWLRQLPEVVSSSITEWLLIEGDAPDQGSVAVVAESCACEDASRSHRRQANRTRNELTGDGPAVGPDRRRSWFSGRSVCVLLTKAIFERIYLRD
jgi:hypothetical protein